MSNDPDDRATAEAAAVLKRMLADRRHSVTDKEAWEISFRTINTWIQARTCNWAVRRGTPKFGAPDAMTVGFAQAALKQIAHKASGMPWGEPLGAWSANDAARLFAIGAEAIEAARVQTLEDPTLEEVGA